MKLFVIFTLIFFAVATSAQNVDPSTNYYKLLLTPLFKNLELDLTPEFFEDLRLFAAQQKSFSASEVAILNDYIDQLFANLKEGLAEHDVNNVTLPNLSLRLDNNGQLNLTNGVLRDITSLTRDGDVEVTYSNDTNILVLILPIRFDDIKYSFDYKAKILLVSAHGGLHGTVKKVKVNTTISLNLNTYQFSLDRYDMTHTGQITAEFTGNSLTDWILDAATAVITAVSHPFLVDQLQNVIKSLIVGIIDSINDAISGVLNPTTASTLSTLTTSSSG